MAKTLIYMTSHGGTTPSNSSVVAAAAAAAMLHTVFKSCVKIYQSLFMKKWLKWRSISMLSGK